MQAFFEWLAANPFVLLFLTVGLSVWLGRQTIAGYGLGMVASAIVVGAGLAIAASTYGIALQIDNFAKSLFYYLFMYGVGLRVGPSFVNSLGGDGLKFTFLAVLSSVMGLAIVVVGAKMFDLPTGAAGGMLAGAMTISAAIGSAEQAITSGVVTLAEGVTPEAATAMIALSYGITYIWGTVGIILICKYLPKWWGVDAKAAAREYEKEHGVASGDVAQLTGWTAGGLRAYRLENPAWQGRTAADLLRVHPEYRVLNVMRGGQPLAEFETAMLQKDDVIALGGRRELLTENLGLIGPEVSDRAALDIALDRAEVLVTNSDILEKTREQWRALPGVDQLQVVGLERAGVQIPVGRDTKLQRMDVLTVVGLKGAVSSAGGMFGRVIRPSTATDLLTLSFGMILGFLIGAISFPAFGASVGLGNAGGLLVSGVIVSSVVARLRFFGNTPAAARNVLEDLGLVVFVAIVGINAGAALLSQLTGLVALQIFLVGFVACSVPPFIVWAIGYHIFIDIPIRVADLLLSAPSLHGVALGTAAGMEWTRGLYLRSLTRGGVQLPIIPGLTLERGDLLSVVGPAPVVDRAAKLIGPAIAPTTKTDFVVLDLAIFIGGVVGLLLRFPVGGGMTVALGTSVGALVAGLIVGHLRTRHPLFGRIPDGAVALMTALGLAAFVALTGLHAGPVFIPALMESGLGLLLGGVVVTLVPLLVGLYFGRYVLGMNPILLLGGLAGALTMTAAMAAVQTRAESPTPVLGYTPAYPIAQILLTLWGSIIVVLMAG